MGHTAIINKHVDDFGILSKSSLLIDCIKSKLSEVYTITSDEEMKFYLGYTILRDRPSRSLLLNQLGYILEFADKYNISLHGPFPTTPMDYLPQKESKDNTLLDQRGITDYQSRVGTLLYLAIQSRPDILYAIAILSSRTKSPTKDDLRAINRVLAYVVGTKELGLRLYSHEGVKLFATVDASYACHPDFKSHSGCTLHIGKDSASLITISKKQKITADSSTSAEFIATHIIAKEIMWARNLLQSLRYPQDDPTTLFEDNTSTIAMIKNRSNGKKTKHIEVRYNLIREQVEKMVIKMQHLSTKDMTSDMLTKPLAPGPFVHLRKKILGMFIRVIRRVHSIFRL